MVNGILTPDYAHCSLERERPENRDEAASLFREYDHLADSLALDRVGREDVVLLARMGGGLAGCVVLRDMESQLCEMQRLFVRPAVRGQRLGRRLVGAAVAEARRRGFRRMRLAIPPAMSGARELYEKMGFIEIPRYRDDAASGTTFLARRLHGAEGGEPVTFADVVAARERIRRPSRAHTPAKPSAPRCRRRRGHARLRQTRRRAAHRSLQGTKRGERDDGAGRVGVAASGVVAATRGNHGLGVAWAGRRLRIPVWICVPLGNNPEKNAAIRALGATLLEEGRDYDESVEVAQRLVRLGGLSMVHSTNGCAVVAGAGTMTLEIVEGEGTPAGEPAP